MVDADVPLSVHLVSHLAALVAQNVAQRLAQRWGMEEWDGEQGLGDEMINTSRNRTWRTHENPNGFMVVVVGNPLCF